MKSLTLTGILLILFGAVMLAYQGFTYTKREQVLDLGPIEATKETRKTVPIPPIVGGWLSRAESRWLWSVQEKVSEGPCSPFTPGSFRLAPVLPEWRAGPRPNSN